MESNKRTIEKILAQALELHEKGVSLHSIVRTYPAHKDEIEDMFSAMALVSKKHIPADVPADGLERILRALPERGPVKSTQSAKSPFSTFWNTVQMTNWKFLVPVAALALLTGGLFIKKYTSNPAQVALNTGALTPSTTNTLSTDAQPLATATPHTTPTKTDQTVAMLLEAPSAESKIIAHETSYERTIPSFDTGYINTITP